MENFGFGSRLRIIDIAVNGFGEIFLNVNPIAKCTARHASRRTTGLEYYYKVHGHYTLHIGYDFSGLLFGNFVSYMKTCTYLDAETSTNMVATYRNKLPWKFQVF